MRWDDLLATAAAVSMSAAAMLLLWLTSPASRPVGAPSLGQWLATGIVVIAGASGFEHLSLNLARAGRLVILAMPAVFAAVTFGPQVMVEFRSVTLPAGPAVGALAVTGGALLGLTLARRVNVESCAHAVFVGLLTAAASVIAGWAVGVGGLLAGSVAAAAVLAAGELGASVWIVGRDPVFAWTGAVRDMSLGYLAQASIGVAAAVVFGSGGPLSVALLVALGMLQQYGFAVLLRTRVASVQTLRAMINLAETQRGANAGHAQRVSAAATRIARRMGCTASEIQSLALAALVHDIGYLSIDLNDSGSSRSEVAAAGATILTGMPALAEIAPILNDAVRPYSEQLDHRDRRTRLAAILAVANALDEHMSQGSKYSEAARNLRGCAGTVLDPSVVDLVCNDARLTRGWGA